MQSTAFAFVKPASSSLIAQSRPRSVVAAASAPNPRSEGAKMAQHATVAANSCESWLRKAYAAAMAVSDMMESPYGAPAPGSRGL